MLKSAPHMLACVLILASCQSPVESAIGGAARDPVNDFIEYNYDFKSDGVVDLYGRLFVPYAYDPASTYGMILFFHGAGEAGSDNQAQVENNITNLATWARANNYFLYAPQLPRNSSNTQSWSASFVDSAVRQFANLEHLYHIDASKRYVTGLSLGGGGTYLSMIRYPGAFAAGTVACGVDPAGAPSLAPLVGQALWSFHATDDPTVKISKFANRINALRALYGLAADTLPATSYTAGEYNYPDATAENQKFRYTNYQNGGHAIWDKVYHRSSMYSWWEDNVKPVADASLQAGERLQIDFGSLVPAVTSDVWNTTLANYQKTLGVVLPYMKTSAGRGTGISLEVESAFEKTFTSGLSGPYLTGIGSDGWQTYANASSTVRLRGLLPGHAYQLELFATTQLAHKVTTYSVSGMPSPLVLDPTNNSSTVTCFVVADEQGSISITVAGDGASASPAGLLSVLALTF